MGTLTANQKKGLASELITNGAWEEDDREWLESLSDKRLGILVANAMEDSEDEEEFEDDEIDLEDDVDETPPTRNAGKPPFAKGGDKKKKPAAAAPTEEDDEEDDMGMKPNCNQSTQEYIANAPPEVQELISNGLDAMRRERTQLVKGIVGNNKITREELNQLAKLPTSVLRTMAKVTTNGKQANRFDLANVSVNEILAMNAGQGEDNEPLPIPEMNEKKNAS